MASSSQYRKWSCVPRIGSQQQQHGTNRRNDNHDRQDEMKQTEDLLASELNKLSVQERAKAFADVHCVGEELQETPEMITKSLAEFEELVQRDRNSVYEMAMTQNGAYVRDPTFRLNFLRANLHNVGKSVRQMMKFLQHKATYFGNDTVARDITLDDLNEEDKRLLWSGLYHIQEDKDRNGRVIIHWFGNLLGRFRAENVIRVTYIVCVNIMLKDPVVQMKGLASVYHNASRSGEEFVMPGMDFVLTVTHVTTSFPIRYSAIHFCLQAAKSNLFLNNLLLRSVLTGLPLYSKVRSRIHVGSMMELQYELRSHGIPMDTFPVDVDGNIRDDILNEWLYRYQRQQDEGNASPLTIDGNKSMSVEENEIDADAWDQQRLLLDSTQPPDAMWAGAEEDASMPMDPSALSPSSQSSKPTGKDVLLGRGRFTQSWAGNIKFREFLKNRSDDYDKVTRKERQKRAIELTHELNADGVRFFEQDGSGEWVEADFAVAMKKVSQLFRSIRKKK